MLMTLQSTQHGGIYLGNAINVRIHGPCTLRHTADAWPYGQATLTSVSADQMEWTMTVRALLKHVFLLPLAICRQEVLWSIMHSKY